MQVNPPKPDDPFSSARAKNSLWLVVLALWLEACTSAPRPTADLPHRDSGELNQQIIRLEQEERYGEALPLAERAFRAVEGQQDAGTVEALDTLAEVCEGLGNYDQAARWDQTSLELRQRLFGAGDVRTVPSLVNLGGVYLQAGRYQEAQSRLESARQLQEKQPSETQELARTLDTLGTLYANLGDYSKARPCYERAAAILERIGGPDSARRLGGIWNNLATVDELQGNYARAEKLYQRAQSAEAQDEKAVAVYNLGCLYRLMNDPGRAEAFLEKAREVRERKFGRTHPYTAHVLADLGELFAVIGRTDRAEPLLAQALMVAEQKQDFALENRALYGLSVMMAKANRREEAIWFGKQAVNNIQRLRGKQPGLSRELQEAFVKSRGGYYRSLAALLIDAGRLGEAGQVLRMLKEEEYFEFIQRGSGDATDLNSTVALSPKEAEWQKRFAAISQDVVSLGGEKARLDQKTGALTAAEQKRLDELNRDLEAASRTFEAALAQIHAETRGARVSEVARMNLDYNQSLQASLGPGTVLLSYVVAEDKVHILLTTAQEPQVARSVTVTGPVLNRAINDFRHVLMHPELNPLPAAQALYRFALAPVEKDLIQASATNLLVCLDGALRYVPLAALHDGKAYVAEKYRVVVLPVAEKARFLPTVPETPSWRVAGFGVTRSVNGLPALPHVREELQGIVKTADGKGGVLPGIIRLDDEFTKVELARIVKSQSPVLHIASHFVFRPGNATDSYLVLGDGDKITLDDFLHKPELKFGRTELLTLSACETAVTETRQGNGIEMDGFAEIAQRHGGAAAIMATLWDVADVSTCEFMKQFYSYHQGQPQLTKAEALQRVQVAFLNQSTAPSEKLLAVTETRGFTVPGPELPADGRLKVSYAHPYFWAPFILIGNGK